MTGVAWLAAALVFARLAVVVVRFARLAPAAKRNYLPARWAWFRWRWLCRNVGLGYLDRHHRRLLRPRAPFTTAVRVREEAACLMRWPRARFYATEHGFEARARTVPRVGRIEFEEAAPYIADAWRCHRVSVAQPGPGRLVVRGLRRDPLAEPLSSDVLPRFDGRHLVLGNDDMGARRSIDLANLSGSVIAGNPGRGKTESAASMAVQLVASPAVELYILDGGACDWAPFAGAAAAYSDDNLADAEELLLELHAQMMKRRRHLEVDLGTRNAWKAGPAPDYPLRWLLVEEASWYFDLEAVKGDRDRERHIRACRGLVAQLLRRGRAPMHHTTLVVQKPVGAGGLPPELRDLCGARWCFGVATAETAVAALGDDIRQYGTLSPTGLQGPEHVGVATVLLKSGLLPYTMVKFPEIGGLADQVAQRAAKRRAGEPQEAFAVAGGGA